MNDILLYGYGDSNMWGWDARLGAPGNRFPEQKIWINRVAAHMGCRLTNDSLPGRRIPAAQMVPLFLRSVAAEPWDILFLMLGVNDLLSVADPIPDQIADIWVPALDALTTNMPERRNRIVLASMTPCTAFRHEWKVISKSYKQTANRFGVRFFDTLSLNLPLQFDGVHLDEAGHAVLADAVCKYILETGLTYRLSAEQ